MATTRSYGDACGIARALDVIGARWALLVVRELFYGPLRFSDLERSLPGASTNSLTDRLRELEASGVVARRRLPPPGAATVYQLTEWGRELRPIVVRLGEWGLGAVRPAGAGLSPTSVLLFLEGSTHPDAASDGLTIRLVLHERVFTATADGGRLHIEAGDTERWDASVSCAPFTLFEIAGHVVELEEAVADGRATVDGDISAVLRLVAAVDWADGG